jgi:hypothetical protein
VGGCHILITLNKTLQENDRDDFKSGTVPEGDTKNAADSDISCKTAAVSRG